MACLVQGHPVTWRQSGLCPHTLACPCPLSLSPLLRADLRAAQVSGPYRERRRHLRLVRPHSGLSTSLGSNLKGSQVLLCSHWKHSYLFIMLEKSLQDRKEMLQSTEFYFFCRFILIPCGFPHASLPFLYSRVQSQLSTPFCRMTSSKSHFPTHLPASGLP